MNSNRQSPESLPVEPLLVRADQASALCGYRLDLIKEKDYGNYGSK